MLRLYKGWRTFFWILTRRHILRFILEFHLPNLWTGSNLFVNMYDWYANPRESFPKTSPSRNTATNNFF